jgi:hypothetical protein
MAEAVAEGSPPATARYTPPLGGGNIIGGPRGRLDRFCGLCGFPEKAVIDFF